MRFGLFGSFDSFLVVGFGIIAERVSIYLAQVLQGDGELVTDKYR